MFTTIVEKPYPEQQAGTCRALVFTGPAADVSRSRVAAVVAPVPGAGQVAIDVEYAGINFKDVMVRRGDPGYVTEWPYVAGLEVAGRIRAIGDGVTEFEVGDPVAAYTGSGGLAEIALADARATVPMPAGVAMASAAVATGVLVTAQLLLHEFGRVRPTDRVLVHGAAGGVGTAVAEVARAAGVSGLMGTVGDSRRSDQAAAAGYSEVLVRDTLDPSALLARLGAVDLILDPQGTSLLDLDLALLRPGGRIILFGNASGGPLGPPPAIPQLLARNAAIGGLSLASLAATEPRLMAAALTRTLRSLGSGELHIAAQPVGLADAPAAQQALADGRGAGKYVVNVRG